MKTFIHCTSFVSAGHPDYGAQRYRRWADYYAARMERFGADRVVLVDDGSRQRDIPREFAVVSAELPLPRRLPEGPVVFRFATNLGRTSLAVYPGWWRSFSFAARLALHYGYERVLHFESDAFVVSSRLADAFRDFHDGWLAMWCPRWGFPETALQAIAGEASLRKLLAHFDAGPQAWAADRGQPGFAEKVLPFTSVRQDFVGDRYGEHPEALPAQADYICQCPPGLDVERRWPASAGAIR